MKRLFRARLLFVVSALIVLSLFVPPRCYPFPRTKIVSASAVMPGGEKKGDIVTFSRDNELAGSKALSESDLLKLLAGGVYNGRIAALVHVLGINFVPGPHDLELLNHAGANRALLHQVLTARRVLPQPPQRPFQVSPASESPLEKLNPDASSVGYADHTLDPEVYIHIRSDRQQETANRIRDKLMQDGYLVPRIIMVSFGPHENQVRYFHDDKRRARSVADELRTLGLTPITVTRIAHYDSNPPGRYELWLAAYAR